MPFYEYECTECKYKFEEFQKMSDDPIKECPKCEGLVKKLISRTSMKVEYSNPKEYYETVIKPEAKEIANKINSGDENAAADFFGDPGNK